MSVAFGLLAVYVGAESVRALVVGAEPDASPVGIGLTVASLVIMPFLSRAQRRTGRWGRRLSRPTAHRRRCAPG
jgi:divalent metal cation (Fe/Co/Zn/Cd) transporter